MMPSGASYNLIAIVVVATLNGIEEYNFASAVRNSKTLPIIKHKHISSITHYCELHESNQTNKGLQAYIAIYKQTNWSK